MAKPLQNSRLCLLILSGVLCFFASLAFAAQQEAVIKDSRPMKEVFKDQKGGAGGGAAPAESVKKQAKYTYDPTGKTDPFKSFIAEQEAVEPGKKPPKPRTYLETLDLSQLELIAIVVGPKGNFAMVRDSKGLGHVIKQGTPIGTNNGVVHAITDKQVTVREEYKDFRGNVQYKDIAKKLPSLVEQQ